MSRATGRRTAAQCVGGMAEDEAARLLERHGLAIIARNYRTRLGEIDLIARDGEVLVFVEVRMRASDSHGDAAESITRSKRRRIESAARHFLARLGSEPPCRFDVVTVGSARSAWLRAAFDAAAR